MKSFRLVNEGLWRVQVLEIEKLAKKYNTHREIAEVANMTPGRITQILRVAAYKHVPEVWNSASWTAAYRKIPKKGSQL